MRIIPCLDVKDGRVVKGVNFVDLVDAGDPVAQARFYDREGADELCFLDITASAEARDTLYDVVRRTAEECFMPLTVGGGVRTVEDIRRLLLAGADKVSINTAAVARPEFVREAARTAVACPSRIPSTRWSSVPTPPEAITGTRTASATARVRAMSKPALVPSRSIEVNRNSPAP